MVNLNSRSTITHRPGTSCFPICSFHTAIPFSPWVTQCASPMDWAVSATSKITRGHAAQSERAVNLVVLGLDGGHEEMDPVDGQGEPAPAAPFRFATHGYVPEPA